LSSPPLTATQPGGGREDLLPRRVRWQTFPPDVRRVTVAPDGKPWFEIEGPVARAALRRQVERAVKLPAPWVRGASILLLDSKGRLWLRPDDETSVLLGYDPRAGTWLERCVAPARDRAGYDEKHPDLPPVTFTTSAHESKGGRLYFSDRLGVHVFAAGKWSYQHLYRLNLERSLYYSSSTGGAFDDPRFAEDGRGRVYVWTRWGRYGRSGTVGFFVHDGAEWTHRLLAVVPDKAEPRPKGGPGPNHLSDVIPLTGNRVVACPEFSPAFTASAGGNLKGEALKQIHKEVALLGHGRFAIREAATRRLALLDPADALPLLGAELRRQKDEETRARLRRLVAAAERALRRPEVDGHQLTSTRVHGFDRRGNAWLWADRCSRAGGKEERGVFKLITREGKVLGAPPAARGWYPDSMFTDRRGRVYFARYREGCVRFDGDRAVAVTDATQFCLRYVLGEDRDGRLYLTDERRVYAFLDGAPEARAALPTTINEVTTGEQDVTVDSLGRVWALVFPSEKPGPAAMSCFVNGAWARVPLPGAPERVQQLRLFLPLKEGCLVAQEAYSRRAYFHDGKGWREYPSLKRLVEVEHRRLVRLIDHRCWGIENSAKLRVDGAGRIWVVEWMEGAVWDGKGWLDLKGPLNAVSPGGTFEVFDALLPLPGGKGMLTSSRLTRKQYVLSVEGGAVKVKPLALPGGRGIENDTRTRAGLWVDARGRVWIPRDGESCVRIDADGPRLLRGTGYPRFEDSRGRVWFHNPYERKLVVLGPKGERGELTDESLSAATVAEDAGGTLWVATERGLLSLRARAAGKGLAVERGKLYEKGAPVGVCLLLAVDRDGNLWFYGYGPHTPTGCIACGCPAPRARARRRLRPRPAGDCRRNDRLLPTQLHQLTVQERSGTWVVPCPVPSTPPWSRPYNSGREW
jgi:streptogramin lyase